MSRTTSWQQASEQLLEAVSKMTADDLAKNPFPNRANRRAMWLQMVQSHKPRFITVHRGRITTKHLLR